MSNTISSHTFFSNGSQLTTPISATHRTSTSFPTPTPTAAPLSSASSHIQTRTPSLTSSTSRQLSTNDEKRTAKVFHVVETTPGGHQKERCAKASPSPAPAPAPTSTSTASTNSKQSEHFLQQASQPVKIRLKHSRWFSFSEQDIERSHSRNNSHDTSWIEQAAAIVMRMQMSAENCPSEEENCANTSKLQSTGLTSASTPVPHSHSSSVGCFQTPSHEDIEVLIGNDGIENNIPGILSYLFETGNANWDECEAMWEYCFEHELKTESKPEQLFQTDSLATELLADHTTGINEFL